MADIINEIYAWVGVLPNGDESIPALAAPNGQIIPLVSRDRQRMESLREHALGVMEEPGIGLRLLKLSVREVLEDLPAKEKPDAD